MLLIVLSILIIFIAFVWYIQFKDEQWEFMYWWERFFYVSLPLLFIQLLILLIIEINKLF